MVFYYLRHLTAKYMVNHERDEILNSSAILRTNQQIRDEYAAHEVINVLVLTGGGVRGLAPLRVLSHLEQLTGKSCGELFDFMAGTSTGAVNCGIMTVPDGNGGFLYSAQALADNYYSDIREMFHAPWYHQFLTCFGLFGPRFLPEGKMNVLERYFQNTTLADVKKNILVPVYDLAENSLNIIRNWEPARDGHYPNLLMRDVIHGASNPPVLFSPTSFSINGKKRVFIDPGVVVNNPAEIALLNAWLMFPNKKIRLVLVGNGGEDALKYNHGHMAEFGIYGLLQYILNSPIISSKLSTDMVLEYIHEAKDYGLDVEFVLINSEGGHSLIASDISELNMNRVEAFAEKMLQEHQETLNELAVTLTS